MNKTLSALALAALAGLTACSVSTEAPSSSQAPSGSRAVPTGSSATASASITDGSGTSVSGSSSTGSANALAKDSCESFNTLMDRYRAAAGTDPEVFDQIYLATVEAGDGVSGDLGGLFTSLGLLALDHAGVAAGGGDPSQDSQDSVRDAVFANASTCTAVGVTLRL